MVPAFSLAPISTGVTAPAAIASQIVARPTPKHAQTTGPAIDALMSAMSDLSLASEDDPPWFTNFYFRSFDHLVVKRS